MVSFFGRDTESRKGFTLVELMIVIAIIGLLAVALLPKLTGAQSNARDVKRKKDLQDIAAALEQVYDERGRYPVSANNNSVIPQELVTAIVSPSNNANCISTKTGSSASFLMEKLDGGKVPLDPSMQKVWRCWRVYPTRGEDFSNFEGSYHYLGLSDTSQYNPWNHILAPARWYILSAAMENYRNANRYMGPDQYTSVFNLWDSTAVRNIWGWWEGWWFDNDCRYYNNTSSTIAKQILQDLKWSLAPLDSRFPKDVNGNDIYNDSTSYTYLPPFTLFTVVKDHIIEP